MDATPTLVPRSVWVYVAITGTIFGASGLLSKGLIDDGVDAFIVTGVPFFVGGLVGMTVAFKRGELTIGSIGPALALGITASVGPALLYNLGFETLPAGIVTLLISLAPVVTAVVAHFAFDDERFNAIKATGLTLAIVGVGILAAGTIDGGGSPGRLGLVGVGAFIGGSAAVLARQMVQRHGAAALIGPQLLTAGVVALTLSPILGRELSPAGGYEIWHILSLAGFGVSSYLGFRSMLTANEIGTTGQVSVIAYCIPIFGVIGGIVVFDDDPTITLFIGGILILVSVWVLAIGSRPKIDAEPIDQADRSLSRP